MIISTIKGCYILIIELNVPTNIRIGNWGNHSFKSGFYAYIGSALNSLEKRIGRHLRKEKKLHWHIDYLLQYAKVHAVIYAETDSKQECRVAGELRKILEVVPGFGCSDCRCISHLYYHRDPDRLKQAILAGFRNVSLVPEEYVC